jgi:hypothetical protein
MLENSGILRPESKYYKTSHYFSQDPRWRVLGDKEREDYFQDHLDDLERKSRDTKR